MAKEGNKQGVGSKPLEVGKTAASRTSEGTGTEPTKSASENDVEYSVESSPNVSQSLGEEDTTHESSESVDNVDVLGTSVVQMESGTSDQNIAHKVFVKLPEPENIKKADSSGIANKTPLKTNYAKALTQNIPVEDKFLLEDVRPNGKDLEAEELCLGMEAVDDFNTSIAHYLIGRIFGKYPGRKAIAAYIAKWNCSIDFPVSTEIQNNSIHF